jgi:hypothetical protein
MEEEVVEEVTFHHDPIHSSASCDDVDFISEASLNKIVQVNAKRNYIDNNILQIST